MNSVGPVTPGDLHETIQLTLSTLKELVDREWSVPAHGLEFSCWEAVEHVSDDLFAYAGQLSGAVVGAPEIREGYAPIGYTRRTDNGPNLTIWTDPASGNAGQLVVLAAMGGFLVSVIAATPSQVRGAHSWGLSDAEGFAAMGITELLLHLFDITSVLPTTWVPPQDICARVLRRLFPNEVALLGQGADLGPWDLLLWATGRCALSGLPRRESWQWDANVR
jgi:hypothetical protein